MFNGANIMNMSAFSLAPTPTSVDIWVGADSGGQNTDSATANYRNVIDASHISQSATRITIQVKASSTTPLTISDSAVGPLNGTGAGTLSMTPITWNGGSASITVPANTIATSDPINYTLSNSVNQVIAIYSTARNFRLANESSPGADQLYIGSATSDLSQSTSGVGFSANGTSLAVSKITSLTPASFRYTYREPTATNPVVLWENGNRLSFQANSASVEAVAASWYWDGSYLYIHASDGSNVATNGKIYEVGTRSFTFYDHGHSYIVYDSIDSVHTQGDLSTVGGVECTGSNNIYQNFSSHDHVRHTFTFYIGCQSSVAQNATLYNSDSTNVAHYGATTFSNTLQNSSLYQTPLWGTGLLGGQQGGEIVMHGGSTNFTVQNNAIHDAYMSVQSGGGWVQSYDSGTSGLKLYRNQFYGVDSGGISLTGVTNPDIAYNTFVITNLATATLNLMLSLQGTTGATFYNNTVYGGNGQPCILSASSSSIRIENNIFYGCYTFESVDASSSATTISDYNDFFSNGGSFGTWVGANTAGFPDWRAATGQDSHSLNSDPQFTNPANNNFSLQSTSPVISSGINLGASYQNAVLPSSSWPSAVVLASQKINSSNWEMGAYLYVP